MVTVSPGWVAQRPPRRGDAAGGTRTCAVPGPLPALPRAHSVPTVSPAAWPPGVAGGGSKKGLRPTCRSPHPCRTPALPHSPARCRDKSLPQQSSPRTRSREKNAERLRGLKLKPTPGIIAGEIHLNKRRWQTSSGSRAGAVMCKDNKIHDKAQREEQGFAIPRYSSINTFPF